MIRKNGGCKYWPKRGSPRCSPQATLRGRAVPITDGHEAKNVHYETVSPA